MSSLITLSIDYIIGNLSKLSKSDFELLQQLPDHIKNRMLKKFTASAYFWRNIDFKNVLQALTHKNTEFLDLSLVTVDDVMLDIINPCRNLRKLNLTRVGQHLITTQGLLNLIPQLQQIYLLTMTNCDAVNDEVIECLSKYCHTLAGLDVGRCSQITDKAVISLSNKNMTNLQWLTFTKTQVTDVGIEHLINGPSGCNLKELRIGECPNITENILKMIAINCPNMEVLVFYKCKTVMDQTCFLFQEGSLKNLKQINWTIEW